MKRLITFLAVFSLACLGAGVASAESAPPAGYNIIDWVNIGDAVGDDTEGGRNMTEWGPSFDAGIWFTPENSDYYRQIWGWTTPPAGYPAGTDSQNWAEIDLDFTNPGSGQRYIGFFFLAGSGDDNFNVYIDGTIVGTVTELIGTNTMVRDFLAVPAWVTDGPHTVKLECSEPGWTSQATYGQVTLDEIYTFADPVTDPVIAPVAVDSDVIKCGGTKLVNFHFTPGDTDVRGYTVRVACDASLTFDEGDVSFNTLPSGVTPSYFVREETLGQVYDIDYVILGGSVGISEAANLFSVNFHGAGTGTGVVSITSADLRALDNSFITPVVFTGTADIEVDCLAPDIPVMDAEPLFTPGDFNLVSWSDVSAAEYEVEMATDAAFTSPTSSGWFGGLSYTFGPILADGQIYYYRVKARDALLNTSGPSAHVSSTQDASPPATTAGVTDPTPDGWVDSFFDVYFTGADATSGIASVELFFQVDGSGYATGGIFSGSTINFVATEGGVYDFYTIATDNVGNVEPAPGAPEATINVDMTAPTTHVDALGPVTITESFTVSYILDLEAGSGLESVDLWYAAAYNGPYANLGPFTGTSMTFDSAAVGGDGTYYFYSIGKDKVGNTELQPVGFPPGHNYDTFTLVDTEGPSVTTFQINNDDPYTSSTSVTLNIDVTGAQTMEFSNDTVTWSGYETYVAGDYAWTLVAGTGPKTVYAHFQDVNFNVTNAQDDINLDTDAPAAVIEMAAARGNNKITISWTNPDDGEVVAEVWRHMWYWDDPIDDPDMGNISAYPEYDDVHDYVVARLGTRQAVFDSPLWELASSSAVPGTPVVDDPLGRGIYYYEVFVQDAAGNWSAPAVDNAYALSYLLGDVAGDDGEVQAGDITVLGAAYGTIDGPAPYNNECDVGPTDDFSGEGIPATDDKIGFEDLMVFALNWGKTVSKVQPAAGSMIARLSWSKVDDTTWALVLVEPCANLKGVNLQADMPQNASLSITPGSLLSKQDNPYFLQNIPANGLDAGMSLLGRDVCITGQGELIRISLAGDLDPEDIRIVARDAANKDLEYSLVETTAVAEIPTRYALSANYPNPFNPSTTIEFALPEAANVQLAIFALDGRRITTLKNESMPAGNHSVVWTGQNDQGGIVAAGIYFYRIQAGDFSQTQKMTLVK